MALLLLLLLELLLDAGELVRLLDVDDSTL